MEGYAIARNNGWMSANDIRALENQNPIPEEDGGNAYLVNGNMISLKTLCLPAENGIKKLASKAADLGTIRLKILACGAAGAAFGYIFGKMKK